MGMLHDPYVSNLSSIMPYRYGYIDLEARFRTIMAYRNMCTENGFECPMIQHYSNPDVFYLGRPTGTPFEAENAISNNSRVLREMAPQIASITQTAEPGTFAVAGHIVTESGFPVGQLPLSLAGNVELKVVSDELGSFIFTGVKDGTYTVESLGNGLEFRSSRAVVEVQNGDVVGVDFLAVPFELKMTLSMVEQPESTEEGNNDGQVNPGEFKTYSIQLTNPSSESIHWPRLTINVENLSEYIETSMPRQTSISLDFAPGYSHEIEKSFFWIDGDTPDGHKLKIPWAAYDGDAQLVATDIIEITVSGYLPTARSWHDAHQIEGCRR